MIKAFAKTKDSAKNLLRKYTPLQITNYYRNWIIEKKHDFTYWRKIFQESVDLAEQIENIPYDQVQRDNWKNNLMNNRNGFRNDNAILEINNTCNIDCLMCKTSLATRKKGVIQKEVLEMAIQRLKEAGYNSYALHTIGDPLANPKLETIFNIFRKHKVKAGLSSNGLLLHKHIDTLLEFMDVCSSIRLSIDSASKEVYEKIRAGGKWETLNTNLNLAKKLLVPKGYSIRIDMVLSRENYHEIGRFIKHFEQYVFCNYTNLNFGFINSLTPDNAYFEDVKLLKKHIYSRVPCGLISNPMPFVLFDGRVSICCRDYDGSLVIGDISNQSIRKIFTNNSYLKELRKMHENGDFKGKHLCSDCYSVDKRIDNLFGNFYRFLLYSYPNSEASFYQERFDSFREIFNDKINIKKRFQALLSSVSTQCERKAMKMLPHL